MKISVIIPTLNEENYIKRTIEKVEQSSFNKPHEIIVVDSGSTDKTINILEGKDIKMVLFNPLKKGRSAPLNHGAGHASGDVLLFLDADSVLPRNYDLYIVKALNKNANVIGGAFEFSLDGNGFLYRVIEFINRVRYRLRKRYYGDQGVFVRKKYFDKAGGFPDYELLESAYLCEKLRGFGKLTLINRCLKTSPRRFEQNGTLKAFAFDIKIWFLDLVGVDVNEYSQKYWCN